MNSRSCIELDSPHSVTSQLPSIADLRSVKVFSSPSLLPGMVLRTDGRVSLMYWLALSRAFAFASLWRYGKRFSSVSFSEVSSQEAWLYLQEVHRLTLGEPHHCDSASERTGSNNRVRLSLDRSRLLEHKSGARCVQRPRQIGARCWQAAADHGKCCSCRGLEHHDGATT